MTGTTAITGDCVATTEAAVEQTGHICEADGEAVKSAQKWNCAPRKITPRSSATLPHGHAQGPDNACHVCQALHMPALAAARLDLSSTPQIVTWYSSAPQHSAPSDSFSLHRAGRAPPTA